MALSATWTTPTERVANEVIDPSDWNTDIGNNLLALRQAAGARVFNSAAISLTTGVEATLTFDSERYDTHAYHSTSSNTARLTVPIAGRYLIGASIRFASNATGYRWASIVLNDATRIADMTMPAVNGTFTAIGLTTIYQLAANDYVTVRATQNSGGALDVSVQAATSPEFFVHFLGGV